ncbi:MAG: hypothetical protein PSV24_16070 [Rhodoferax sp.]|nr:hypothetical protein [Rhodoferax sp.]
MNAQRNVPHKAGSNKLLWAGVAVVTTIVLLMGATLIRSQATPEEPRLVVLPALDAPPTDARPAVASAATEPTPLATPLPPTPAANDPLVDSQKPRSVPRRTSEPAVARAPQRDMSKPDTSDSDTAPNVKR